MLIDLNRKHEMKRLLTRGLAPAFGRSGGRAEHQISECSGSEALASLHELKVTFIAKF